MKPCPFCAEQIQDEAVKCRYCNSDLSRGAPGQAKPETKAGAWVTLVGGVLLAVSGFLPWFSASIGALSVSRNGMQLGQDGGFSVDGLLMLLLGLAAIFIGIGRASGFPLPRPLRESPIVVGVVAVVLALLEIPSIHTLVNNVRNASSLATASIGFGIFIAIFAGLVVFVGGLMLRSAARPAREIPPATG